MPARIARTGFWLALVAAVVLAMLPQPPAVLNEANDKALHMLAFAVLAALASVGFPATPPLRLLERLSFVGALIEVFQSLPVLHRDCDPLDWAADTAAVGAALGLVALVRYLLRRRRGGAVEAR